MKGANPPPPAGPKPAPPPNPPLWAVHRVGDYWQMVTPDGPYSFRAASEAEAMYLADMVRADYEARRADERSPSARPAPGSRDHVFRNMTANEVLVASRTDAYALRYLQENAGALIERAIAAAEESFESMLFDASHAGHEAGFGDGRKELAAEILELFGEGLKGNAPLQTAELVKFLENEADMESTTTRPGG